MSQLDRANLSAISVYVGEKDYHTRQKLREMFVAEGIKNVSTHGSAGSLKALMLDVPPDLLVLSDDFDPKVFEFIQEIRHNKLGQNPFVVISMLVGQRGGHNIQKAISAGADDVVIKPLDPRKVHERLRLITYFRQPFIATADYVGPDRKGDEHRHLGAKRVEVLNTMQEKANGRNFESWELQEAVDASMGQVLEAQLSSQSLKMGALCDQILDAYKSGLITQEVQIQLEALRIILEEAASMAKRLKDASLQTLCLSLAENVGEMEGHYASLDDSEIDLMEKLAQAFRMAIDSAAQRSQKEEDAQTEKYKGRVAGNAVDL